MTASPTVRNDFGHARNLRSIVAKLGSANPRKTFGEICGGTRNTLRARFSLIGLGSICRVRSSAASDLLAEVIALDGKVATLSVMGDASTVRVGDRIEHIATHLTFPFYDNLPGQVLNGIGQPIGFSAPATAVQRAARSDNGTSVLDRPLIDCAMHTGVAAIDGFLTLGRGQRVALFGPPGCGKSRLLADIVANCSADLVVMALVGERGREVQEFLQRHLPRALRKRCILVVSTSDRPAMERAYAAEVASSIAEGFRDQGKHVLLLVDSMTRVARALREIGLAAGEPPVRRGFPASVYAALPKIMERAGLSPRGSITAIYAVLSEGDVSTDPIIEEIKSLSDGHIQLDPELAAAGRFPAIDVVGSLSRVMPAVVNATHMEVATHGRRLLAKYKELKLLIQIGEYRPGQDREADNAIARIDQILAFLHPTGSDAYKSTQQTLREMRKVLGR